MKFPISRRKQEQLQKISSFHERLENIKNLTDPAERLLMLDKLSQETKKYSNMLWNSRQASDISTIIGGTIGTIAGCALVSPLFLLVGIPAVAVFIAKVPATEETLDALTDNLKTVIEDTLKKEDLVKLAASPHLASTIQQFPVLTERFDAATKAQNYQKALLPALSEKKKEISGKHPLSQFKL